MYVSTHNKNMIVSHQPIENHISFFVASGKRIFTNIILRHESRIFTKKYIKLVSYDFNNNMNWNNM
jgi:hypothetical protein